MKQHWLAWSLPFNCLRIALLAALALTGAGVVTEVDARGGQSWFSAWTVSHGARLTTPALANSSVRMIVRPSVSGHSVRVKIENTLGQAPVSFSSAWFGKVAAGAELVAGSNRPLTFGGSAGLTLAAGASAWSDPLPYDVHAFSRYAVSLDVSAASDISAHSLGIVTNYMAPGAHAADAAAGAFTPVPNLDTGAAAGASFPFYWVASVDVDSPATTGTIVAFGDSITDGRCSTKEGHGSMSGKVIPDLYQRWTDVLAERLSALPENQSKAVADEGIAGNRIVSGGTGPTGLSRMERDVLARQGATHIVFFEGTNDITGGATADTVIAGTQQVIDRARLAGLKIIGVTIIPRGSAAGFTAFMEQQRLAVNQWMRSTANFDGIIDFAELMKGAIVPANGAEMIKPEFSCFDGIHPNDTGYRAMGDFIDLNLFRNQAQWNNGGPH